jgi:hypothetical protein
LGAPLGMIRPVVVVVGFLGFRALTVVVVTFFLVVMVFLVVVVVDAFVVVVVVVGEDATRHVGTVMVFESSVTAPFRASTRP